MRLLFCNDVHLSGRPPVSRIDNYIDELFDLLDQIAAEALRRETRAVIIAGDVFHDKSRTSVPVLVRLFRWCHVLREQGVHVWAVAGNHDLQFNRYETLPDQPLGLMFATGIMRNLAEEPVVEHLPHGAGCTVQIQGLPFPDAFDRQAWDRLEPGPEDGVSVVVAHCFASMVGGSYFGEPVHAYTDLAQLPHDVFVFGHDHSDGGIVTVPSSRGREAVFCNLGALSRGALSGEDVSRVIRCGQITIDGPQSVSAEPVPLRFRPAAEIFDLSAKAARDAEHAQIDQFVSELTADLIEHSTVDTPLRDRVQSLGLTEVIRSRILAYLEAAEQSVGGA